MCWGKKVKIYDLRLKEIQPVCMCLSLRSLPLQFFSLYFLRYSPTFFGFVFCVFILVPQYIAGEVSLFGYKVGICAFLQHLAVLDHYDLIHSR